MKTNVQLALVTSVTMVAVDSRRIEQLTFHHASCMINN